MTISPNNIILEAKSLKKSFGDNCVIGDISLEVKEGELVSILGVSGVGKTTLFNMLSGLSMPDSGTVSLKGKDITGKPGEISYMLQKDLLLPYRTVIDNVALPLIIKGMKKKDARKKADPYFEEFGIEGTQKKYPAALSGGMRQRAALLRTYLASSGVALLDEPFSALDTITRSAMHDWYLDVMKDINLTTLFITHDMDEAIKLSDRICILGDKPARIVKEIKIDVPRPRTSDFTLTNEFLQYKKEIAETLKRQTK